MEGSRKGSGRSRKGSEGQIKAVERQWRVKKEAVERQWRVKEWQWKVKDKQ